MPVATWSINLSPQEKPIYLRICATFAKVTHYCYVETLRTFVRHVTPVHNDFAVKASSSTYPLTKVKDIWGLCQNVWWYFDQNVWIHLRPKCLGYFDQGRGRDKFHRLCGISGPPRIVSQAPEWLAPNHVWGSHEPKYLKGVAESAGGAFR